MKKSIIFATLFLIVLLFLAYNKYDTKEKITNYFYISDKMGKVYTLNNNLDLFKSNILHYNNYDHIEKDIKQIRENFAFISSNHSIENTTFQKSFYKLQKDFEKKIFIIQKIKSYNAILNNSFRYIQKLKYKIQSRELIELYFTISILDKSTNIDYEKILEQIETYKVSNSSEELFLAHAKILFNYFQSTSEILDQESSLEILEKLKNLMQQYDVLSNENINKAHILVVILFVLLILSIFLYLYDAYNIFRNQKDLKKFRNTIENSDNIIIITDKYENIKFVNKAFINTYGYSLDEVKGEKPSILKSGEHDDRFYKELHQTIHQGKKWVGTFINIGKSGQKQYERASITPIFDDNGQIEEFVAIKLNITKEIETQQALRESEQVMMQQSKMASMGEMLSNIAHQWRQPLSMISTVASGVKVKKQYATLNDEELIKYMDDIGSSIEFLSKTIDDFRDYFKPDKQKTQFSTVDIVDRSLKILGTTLENNEIAVVKKVQDIQLNQLDGELMQVLINILNNAKDVLNENKVEHKVIEVEVKRQKNRAIFIISDNGGGVPVNIINNIFEPYFTTKHKSQGTGIGLYMSHQIITKHMGGFIGVENGPIVYKNREYQGAKLTVDIPIG
jgi:PAS domain S-box-containing protein